MNHDIIKLGLGFGLIVLLGCASTELEVKGSDPANPAVALATSPATGSVLRADFDPHQVAADPVDDGKKEGTIWTCPMHPEIKKSEPGNCPICGMKLQPAKPAPKQGTQSEQHPSGHQH